VRIILGFLFYFFFVGFQIRLSSLLRLETYFSKSSFRISWSVDLSFLLVSDTCCSDVWCVSSLTD